MEWNLVEAGGSCHGSRWKLLHLLPRKLLPAFIVIYLFSWKYLYFHSLPWKHNLCLLPWRLPATSICFHLIPHKLPPTFMEVGRLPACLEVGQLPWKWLQLPWKQQTRSKNFRLPKQTHGYVEANGSRSNSIWMLVEVAGKLDGRLCGSYTTSVEVGGSKGK